MSWLVWKDLPPSAEGLVCGHKVGASPISGADELEQDGGFRLVFADIGEVVEDQQVEAIKPVDGGLEGKFPTRQLEPLHQVGGSGEPHAPDFSTSTSPMSSSSSSILAITAQLMPSSSNTSALARRARRCAANPSRANSIWSLRDSGSSKPGRIMERLESPWD